MDNCYLGSVRMFGGNWAPRNWAFCDGRQMPINQNQALYALLGTTYGGNGTTYFNLPDLRGRVGIGYGQGTGMYNIPIGTSLGTETVTMTMAQMPQHSHSAVVTFSSPEAPVSGSISIPVSTDATEVSNEVDRGYLAQGGSVDSIYTEVLEGSAVMATSQITMSGVVTDPATGVTTLTNTGSGAPFSIIQPTIAMNYIICIAGLFPSRN